MQRILTCASVIANECEKCAVRKWECKQKRGIFQKSFLNEIQHIFHQIYFFLRCCYYLSYLAPLLWLHIAIKRTIAFWPLCILMAFQWNEQCNLKPAQNIRRWFGRRVIRRWSMGFNNKWAYWHRYMFIVCRSHAFTIHMRPCNMRHILNGPPTVISTSISISHPVNGGREEGARMRAI